MTLLAAFKVLLYRYTGQTDFAVGSPIANRTRSELEGLIGFFVNTLVLRTDLSGDPRFIDFLGRVRETTLGAFAHQDTPFEKVVEAVNPFRDMSYSPLFQVMFALQNIPRATLELPGSRLSPVEIDAGTSMFDLTLYMWEGDKGLSGSVEYNTDLFDARHYRTDGWPFWHFARVCRCRPRSAYFGAGAVDGGRASQAVGGVERDGSCVPGGQDPGAGV